MFSNDCKRRGFTLLEVVCTLIILGVLGGLVFSGFSSALTGYAQMRASTATYMQAELALIRLRKELADVLDIFKMNGKGNSLFFRRADGTPVSLYLEGDTLIVKEGDRSAPLLGGVRDLSIDCDPEGYDGSALPRLITVTFTLDAPAGPKTYSLAVSPRNTPPAEG